MNFIFGNIPDCNEDCGECEENNAFEKNENDAFEDNDAMYLYCKNNFDHYDYIYIV